MADVLTGQWLAVLRVFVERQQERAFRVVGELATFRAEYRVCARRYQSTGRQWCGFGRVTMCVPAGKGARDRCHDGQPSMPRKRHWRMFCRAMTSR